MAKKSKKKAAKKKTAKKPAKKGLLHKMKSMFGGK
jgi:hypothetical protein